MTKRQIKTERYQLYGKYDTVAPLEMLNLAEEKRATLPDELKHSVSFELDEYYADYDDNPRVGLFLTWSRYETDEELAIRVRAEAVAEMQRKERDQREFERLSKIFKPEA
jgi:hypothetical protein